MLNEKTLIKMLNKSGYSYNLYKHKALFSVEESIQKRDQISGVHTKNLFLKNKKNKFFLFSCIESTKLELKKLSKNLNIGNISFANEEYLFKLLGVKPGSVTPFGLLNDKDDQVKFYFDKNFLSEKTINFHPLVNTATINMKIKNLIKFLIEKNKKVNMYDFNNHSLFDR